MYSLIFHSFLGLLPKWWPEKSPFARPAPETPDSEEAPPAEAVPAGSIGGLIGRYVVSSEPVFDRGRMELTFRGRPREDPNGPEVTIVLKVSRVLDKAAVADRLVLLPASAHPAVERVLNGATTLREINKVTFVE